MHVSIIEVGLSKVGKYTPLDEQEWRRIVSFARFSPFRSVAVPSLRLIRHYAIVCTDHFSASPRSEANGVPTL